MAKLTVEKLRKLLAELPGDTIVEAWYDEGVGENDVVLLKTYEFKEDDLPEPRSLVIVTRGSMTDYGYEYFKNKNDGKDPEEKIIFLEGVIE